MLVCGQSEARRFHAELQPSHVLSIVTPGRSYLGPKDVSPDRHLKVEFDDVEEPASAGAPTIEQMRGIIAFVEALPEEASLCLHGLQGVRRAPAVGLGILASLMPAAEAAAALAPFCRHSPDPNRLVVRLFDAALAADGALIRACESRFVAGSGTLLRRSQDDRSDFDFGLLALDEDRVRRG